MGAAVHGRQARAAVHCVGARASRCFSAVDPRAALALFWRALEKMEQRLTCQLIWVQLTYYVGIELILEIGVCSPPPAA